MEEAVSDRDSRAWNNRKTSTGQHYKTRGVTTKERGTILFAVDVTQLE